MQTATRGRRLRFAQFELDLNARELFRDGRPVRIQPQPLRVLEILVVQAGTLVTREELRQRVWDEATFVEFDQGLNYCIRQIRVALGDDAATPVFIETLKKRGYRFTAPVEVVGSETGRSDEPDAAKTAPASIEAAASPLNADRSQGRSPRSRVYVAVAAVLLAAVVGFVALRVLRSGRDPVAYEQLTSFTEAAFEPAVSPDGRTMAFLVGSDAGFPFIGQVYTMMLPDGEPIQRTHDAFSKYGVAFSPDGSQITYTAVGGGAGWNTMSLPLLGGEPRLLLHNAAGLSWLDQHHALFSEILSGLHMAMLTATDRRESPRRIYVPGHERGMAHYGYASPDRQSVLIVEMANGGFTRCRLAPFDGHTDGSQVGPDGPCTSAAWSSDGRWMYFTAAVDGARHVWREPFPSGELQQITSGPAQEGGIAMSPDGRSLVAALGIPESGAWLHTAQGEQLLSADGYASLLRFSPDGRFLFYVLRHASSDVAGKLWQTELSSVKRSELLAPTDPLTGYSLSPDGTQIVYGVKPAHGPAEIWLTARDGHVPPRRLTASGEDQPTFGPGGEILFRQSENHNNYVFEMNPDGSDRRKVTSTPIVELRSMSPDRRVAFAMAAVSDAATTAVLAIPLDRGPIRRVCPGSCRVKWSPDGATMYITPFPGERAHLTIAIPVPQGESMPVLPVAGVQSEADTKTLPGSGLVDFVLFGESSRGDDVAPGPVSGTFAYTHTTSHHNLFRVPLP
jgi:DNA-binding winged helix-turn-helix (wHTH) protein/Tol biopolymer transport system component